MFWWWSTPVGLRNSQGSPQSMRPLAICQRFEEGLAPYIRNYLAGQPIQSSQKLYERAVDVKRIKNELRMAHSVNPKRRWNERGNQVEGSLSKKSAVMKSKSQESAPNRKHCTKCRRTNHDTSQCRVGTNRCFWCGDPSHLIANCPTRTAQLNKGSAPLKSNKTPSLQPATRWLEPIDQQEASRWRDNGSEWYAYS